MTIWKYPLPVAAPIAILIPRGAQLLTVQLQYGQPMLWAMVPEGGTTCERKIVTLATGESFTVPGAYVGTYQLEESGTVWHVFDGGEKQ